MKKNKTGQDLTKELHSALGDDLYLKLYEAFPKLQEEKIFARKGILWYTLHNQLEAIYRIESCKEALDQFLDLMYVQDSNSSTKFSRFLATLDSLKLILINLIGDLNDPEQSYYVLDNAMSIHQESGKNIVEYIFESAGTTSQRSTSNALQKKLNRLKNLLNSKSCNRRLINELLGGLKKLFSIADSYSVEVDAFTKCDQSSEILLYGYRRVTAVGLNLLSNLILVQSLIEIVEPHLCHE